MSDNQKTSSGCNRKEVYKDQQNYPSEYYISLQDTINGFTQSMKTAGLYIKDPTIADGKLHRFYIEGDRPGSRNGWYIFYTGDLAAGAFGCWKRQISKTWCSKTNRQMTSAERLQFKQRLDAIKKIRKAEEQERRRNARRTASIIWTNATKALDNHPYLIAKSVRSYGLRCQKDRLIIPLHDNEMNLQSLQFIDCDGNKLFLSGGLKKGCYFLIGNPTDTLCIAEGYATGASIYEATEFPVAIAFDAGNLISVAQALREKFPNIEIIICADNDDHLPDNPGLTKARGAAASIHAHLAIPPCSGDFNDLYRGAIQ